ncbi:MAG: T9SS type A sorting domain-containing protein [Bacteroidia bacterium]|nr:T9SS type A sorting domain-containing protein [Bacteroidia bacterium]
MSKNKFSLSNSNRLSLQNKFIRGSIVAGLLAAGLFLMVQNSSSDPSLIDTDGDGIMNIDDLDDDNDGIPDSKECQGTENTQYSIINGGFESPVITRNWRIINENDVPGWHTTASRNGIEIWISGFLGIDAYEGGQLAELNAYDPASTYQVINTTPGEILHWSFAHRGRTSHTVPDVMQIEIGPEGSGYNYSQVMSDTRTEWGYYSGTYTIPAGQTTTRFALTAVSTASGNASVGNLVDDFQLYSVGNCLVDTDGDGIPNSEDLDSDNDGIMDIVEAGGTDVDKDGRVDYQTPGDPTSMLDEDGDGLMDLIDDEDSGSGAGEVTNGTALPLYNTDGIGEADYLDIDADDDGIVDNIEGQTTAGYIAPSDEDTDEDGLDDAYDKDCSPCGSITGMVISPINSGGSALPDYRDTDSDGDGLLDEIEAHDTNGDGTVDGNDTPFANTGKNGGTTDADEDGLLDGFDNDLINYDPTNGSPSASAYSDNNLSTTEMDWRESVNFPVEWLDFSVKLDGADAHISWSTAMEINNDYFEIQRSPEGQVFDPIGKVKGVGFTDEVSTYDFEDKRVSNLSLDHIYYRIKQVDFDGQFSLSPIVELLVDPVEGLSMNVFPNPTRGPITVDWNLSDQMSNATISLLNINGQVLKQTNATGLQNTVSWDLQGLPQGIYFVKFRSMEKELAKKLILE